MSREYAIWYVTSATKTMSARTTAATSIRPGNPATSSIPMTPVTGSICSVGSAIIVPSVVSK